jgi:hypothetical protein
MKNILVLLIIFTTACKKCPLVPASSLAFEEGTLGFCLSSKISKTEYIIENETQLNDLFLTEKCTGQVPSIDFANKTLLGKYTSGQCDVKIKKSLQKDDKNKTYTYYISICEKGNCKKMVSNMNWIIVDKVKAGYSVGFVVLQKSTF